jgi:hypothetical protein
MNQTNRVVFVRKYVTRLCARIIYIYSNYERTAFAAATAVRRKTEETRSHKFTKLRSGLRVAQKWFIENAIGIVFPFVGGQHNTTNLHIIIIITYTCILYYTDDGICFFFAAADESAD